MVDGEIYIYMYIYIYSNTYIYMYPVYIHICEYINIYVYREREREKERERDLKHSTHIDKYSQILTYILTTNHTSWQTEIFQKGMSGDKNNSASLKRPKHGWGLPIHKKLLPMELNISIATNWYILWVLNKPYRVIILPCGALKCGPAGTCPRVSGAC